MALSKKIRERDEEEYLYQLKTERKKEQDEYELIQAKKRAEAAEKIIKKVAELDEREKSINNRLEDIENMKKEVEGFPKKLEAAGKEAGQEARKELEKDFAIQKKITEAQWTAEKKIFENKIIGLQETTKNQASEIANLKKSLVEANQRAQNLAIAIVQNTTGSKLSKSETDKQQQINKTHIEIP